MSTAVIDEERQGLLAQFQALTMERQHNLSRDMVKPTRTLTTPQLRAMIAMLLKRDHRPNICISEAHGPALKVNDGDQVRVLEEAPFMEIAQHTAPPARRTKKDTKAELEAKAAAWELRWNAMGTPEKIRDAQREAREQGSDTHHGKIPEGFRYAIPNLDGSTDLSFYLVKHGEGKWRNTTFVERIIGGHPNEDVYSWDTKQAIYREIRKLGIEASQLLAGREIRKCRDCNSDLTNPVSRMLCQGPVCGGRN